MLLRLGSISERKTMGHWHARSDDRNRMQTADSRGIRRHLQELEQQVQQLRQRIDPASAEHLTPIAKLVGPISYGKLRSIIAARRARDRHFDRHLFSDPAWDILLELYASELAQQRMTISRLCVAAAVPSSTALRWVGTLEKNGLIERRDDPLDGRRVFVSLTGKGRDALNAYFSEEVSLT